MVHNSIETFWCWKWTLLNTIVFICNKVVIFMQFSAPMEIWPKRTQKCVYADEMLLSTISLNHQSPINLVPHINLDTSDVRMQHLCITTPNYGGLYMTFYDLCNTQYFVDFSRHTSAKMKSDQQVVVLTFSSIKTCQTL